MFLRTPLLGRRIAPMAMRRPTLVQPCTMIGNPLFFANMGLMRQFNATTLNIDAAGPRTVGPVPIKINVGQQLSSMDLLQAELAKAQAEPMPECFYPKTV